MLPELDVRDGQTVTVEGYVVAIPGRDLLGDERFVLVGAFESDGTRVVIPRGTHVGPMGGALGGGARGRMGGAPGGRLPGAGLPGGGPQSRGRAR